MSASAAEGPQADVLQRAVLHHHTCSQDDWWGVLATDKVVRRLRGMQCELTRGGSTEDMVVIYIYIYLFILILTNISFVGIC